MSRSLLAILQYTVQQTPSTQRKGSLNGCRSDWFYVFH